MFGTLKKGDLHLRAIDRMAGWTRARFKLRPEDAVLVAEIACGLPGCPPLETVVAFWTADGTRHRFKLFKPVAEVAEADLPPAWLRPGLAAPEGYDEDCC
jgi:hypothetical protein